MTVLHTSFLPFCWIIFSLLGLRKNSFAQIIWLCIASLFFYAIIESSALLLIAILTIVNYFFGKWLQKKPKKFELGLFIFLNALLLLFYKNAFISLWGKSWILPLGLSFLTLQLISFLYECYQRKIPDFNFFEYWLYALFFPRILSGPIVLFSEFLPQIRSLNWGKFSALNINKGLLFLAIGAFKKIVLADSIYPHLQKASDLILQFSTLDAWIFALANILHIYFDFSGYIDMALGCALLFNIKLPQNFDSPLKSHNVQEFWRRWHMTIRRFWVQHVYIPLGGNRHGIFYTISVIWTTFLLSGYWHGATLQFLLYGAIYAFFYTIFLLFEKTNLVLPKTLSWFLTISSLMIGSLFISLPALQPALEILERMLSFDFSTLILPKTLWLMSAVFLLIAFMPKNSNQLAEGFKPSFRNLIFISLLFSTALIFNFYINKQVAFVYFKY